MKRLNIFAACKRDFPKVSPSYSVFDILASSILGAFAKLLNETVGFVMSVHPRGTARRSLGGFS